jgi:hypothetical protein
MGSRLREGTKQVFDCFLEIVPAREEVSLLVFFHREKEANVLVLSLEKRFA